jgi:nucleoside 2-deoxyribosyltransferase
MNAPARLQVYKPPAELPTHNESPIVFLAGSIEQGSAQDWQAELGAACEDLGVVFLNPRRDSWDSTWEQRSDNPQFRAQVEWELDGLDRASLIIFYFAPNTRSPVTLLELGLHAASGKVVVCCPDGFWRKGNIDITCERYGVPQVESLNELASVIRERFSR